MRAFIDTCVVIDALQSREPFAKDAQDIFLAAANNLYLASPTSTISCTGIRMTIRLPAIY